jgi:hypothetical protein
MGRVQARSSLGPTSGLSYFLTRLRSGVVGNRLWRIVVGWSLSRRWASLGLIGLASQLLYWNFFLRPYPLLANYAVPLLDLGKLTRRSPAAALDFAAVFVALFALSYAAHSLCRGRSSSRAFALVLLVAFLCGLALVFVYPITAADVFEYIAYARITVEHGVNPHLFRPADFPNDPFMTYSAWPYITSPYGPLWTYVSALIGWMSGASLLTYLLLFKGLALLVHLVNSGLIYATLRRWSSSYALAGAVLYAWNPLVLFESAAGAHNDGAVMLPVLAAIYLFVRRRFALSIVVSALGCLVKMPMIIVVRAGDLAGFVRGRKPAAYRVRRQRCGCSSGHLASRPLVGRVALVGMAGEAGPVHIFVCCSGSTNPAQSRSRSWASGGNGQVVGTAGLCGLLPVAAAKVEG